MAADVAGRGRLLGACGDVDGVPGRRGLGSGRIAGNDLAGIDARANRQAHAPGPLELLVQGRLGRLHLARRAYGTQRVVLV